MALPLSQSVVEQWISLLSRGKFNVREAWAELDIASPEGKQHLRVILRRLPNVSPDGGGGNYRKIDFEAPIINWREANSENIIPLEYPFGIEKYASIYPKNVIIIAGVKQEGKTTFLYNFIKLNMHKYQIDLFNSETGAEQMKDRFIDLGIPLDAPFEAYERYDNFADVIKPDHISVIDYLDTNSEFYMVGAEIDAIFRKLTTGIAIIGMQIPPPSVTYQKGVKKIIERDYAYGGGVTAKRAFIYISLSSHKLKLKHAKKPAQKFNPENMIWSYNFDDKGQFCDIQRFYPSGVEAES